MFELPRAIQQDNNTTVKLLYQVAQDAQEQQQRLMQLAQRNEQVRREAFGGAQKQLFDISSAQNVPTEVQNSILKNGLDALIGLYKNKSGVKSADLGMMASSVLMDAKQKATAYQQYLTNGEKMVADLKEKGFDEVNLKSILSNSVFDNVQAQGPQGPIMARVPKDPTKLGDPIQFLMKEVDSNPQKYLNRELSGKKLNEYFTGYKPGELEQTTTTDLTGTKTIKVSSTEKSFPWTRVQEEKDPTTGQIVKLNVLDTEQLTDGKGTPVFDGEKPVQILSTNAFNNVMSSFGNDVVAMKEIDALGRDAIDDHNRMRGVNPQQLTPENFDMVARENQGLINPFDANNRAIYSRLALTKRLMPQFGRFGKTSVTVDVAKPTTVNLSNDLYTRTGNIRPEAKFPTAWAQIVNQDADVMRVAENLSFQFDGKPITGRRVGDRAQGQIIKDNGKRATVVARPEEPGSVYIVELDSDGEPTDVVTKLAGQQAIDYGSKISSANGSDIKTFNKLFPSAMKTVVTMSDAERANVDADVDRASSIEEGKALLGRVPQIRVMGENETITANNALVNLNGKEVRIKSIFREDTPFYRNSPIRVTLSNGTVLKYTDRDAFVKDLINSNK